MTEEEEKKIIKELDLKTKALEKQLLEKNIKIIYLEKMIELTQQELGIDIVKDTKSSKFTD